MTAVTRLAPADVLRVGLVGVRTRRLRTALAAAGIAIGIGAMVAVLGISESSRAALLSQLDRLGTNLLEVGPGQTFLGADAELPEEATAMIARIGPVRSVASVKSVSATVRRTDQISELETGGIGVRAVDVALLNTLGGSVRDGAFLTEATAGYPAAVLGSVAAERLGLDGLAGEVRVWIGGRWFTVVGILRPVALATDLDRATLIGYAAAETYLDEDRSPSTVYVRTDPEDIDEVRAVLPVTADPETPEEVEVSRPSDALEARAAAAAAFTSLFLGLGAVALFVGGIGIANVMVISVLERRSEIGLRRALGATRGHIRLQFLTEAVLLAGAGGLAGSLLGASITAAYASQRGWQVALPPWVLIGGTVVAVAVGTLAGLYPATRAARLSPTDALRSA
ncbi:MAG: ABC transporter permease [Actinomycetota bacterium]